MGRFRLTLVCETTDDKLVLVGELRNRGHDGREVLQVTLQREELPSTVTNRCGDGQRYYTGSDAGGLATHVLCAGVVELTATPPAAQAL